MEVFGSEAKDRIALLVFDVDRLNHQLGIAGERSLLRLGRECKRQEYEDSNHLSEPQADGGLDATHRVGGVGQAELTTRGDGVPTGKDGIVEGISEVEAGVQTQAITGQPEGTAE